MTDLRPTQADNVLRVALVQAAVPLEGLLACRQWVSLTNETWAEIENGVAHIRAALKASPTTEPNPEGKQVGELLREARPYVAWFADGINAEAPAQAILARIDSTLTSASNLSREDVTTAPGDGKGGA